MDIQLNVTLAIIVLTCLISYKGFKDRSFFEKLKHSPYAESKNKEWYRMLTSGFLHGDVGHLLLNMIVLLSFGNFVESYFVHLFSPAKGRILYLLMYLTCIIAADIPSFFKHKNNAHYAAIGASGAVSGILFISILYRPLSPVYLMFAIPIKGIIFGVLYLGYESWAAKKAKDNIGHDAHFYGALYGMLFITVFNYQILSDFIQQIASIF